MKVKLLRAWIDATNRYLVRKSARGSKLGYVLYDRHKNTWVDREGIATLDPAMATFDSLDAVKRAIEVRFRAEELSGD